MSSKPIREAIRNQLARKLESRYLLEQVAEPGKLFDGAKPGSRRFHIAAGDDPLLLRVRHAETTVHGVVCDHRLGTLGLIHVLETNGSPGDEDEPGRPDHVAEDLYRRVGEAVYLRHVLEERGCPEEIAHTVEVVFAVEAGEAGVAGHVRDALRGIMRETNMLHAVGVNLLEVDTKGEEPVPVDKLRRAFCWLLHDVDGWYDGGGEAPGGEGLRKLAVEDFRVAGRRTLTLRDGPFHLVHGSNGSGKSSLVEALEYMFSGRIERLGNHLDYAKVITNNQVRAEDPEALARVSVWIGEAGQPRRESVTRPKADTEAMSAVPASRFRLDQVLADALARGGPGERARLFLEAFFPEEARRLAERKQANHRLAATREQLPDALLHRLPKRNTVQRIVEGFGQTFDEPKTAQQLDVLLPFPVASLHAAAMWLGRDLPEPEERLATTYTEILREAQPIIEELRSANGERLIRRLLRAQGILGGVQFEEGAESKAASMEPPDTGSDRGYGELVDEWLQLMAAADIVEKQQQVWDVRGGLDPDRLGDHAELLEAIHLPDENVLEAFRAAVPRLRAERDEARARVDAARPEPAQGSLASPSLAEPMSALDDADRGLLDDLGKRLKVKGRIGKQLFNLGTAVARGLKSKRRPTLLMDGRELSFADLAQWAAEGADAGKRLIGSQPMDPDTAVALVRDYHAALLDLWKHEQEAVQAFGQRLAPMRDALNEFMALLTPARWAYEDVQPRYDDKQSQLNFEGADEVAAELRLNTAEQNILVLALYLLCAVSHQKNEFKLVVLDDPLQNMDELTVSTLARGLARLFRLWKRKPALAPWKVLMLLHAEDNVSRVRSEISCPVYFLPWLKPRMDAATEENAEIKVEPVADTPVPSFGAHDFVLERVGADEPA